MSTSIKCNQESKVLGIPTPILNELPLATRLIVPLYFRFPQLRQSAPGVT